MYLPGMTPSAPSVTNDSHDTSWLSHDPHDIYNHLIALLCNGIRPYGESTSVKGSTESAVLQEAFRRGRPIPHRQNTLEGLWITDSLVPPQRSSGTWLMTSHGPATIFMTHVGRPIFRYYILALAVQGPTRLSPLDRWPGYSFPMTSFLHCSCWFIHSHDPLLFHYLYQHSHTPFLLFPFWYMFLLLGILGLSYRRRIRATSPIYTCSN